MTPPTTLPERLRAVSAGLTLGPSCITEAAAHIEALEAQNAALRDALEPFAQLGTMTTIGRPISTLIAAARQALTSETP